MKLASSELIKKIDTAAEKVLGIPLLTLMERAGKAVADAASGLVSAGSKILILCGKGNNGGDGYAAASMLAGSYNVTICGVPEISQRSNEGAHFLEKCKSENIPLISLESPKLDSLISSADLIIDAVLGVGFAGVLSEPYRALADKVNSSKAAVLAVDLPLGISANTAEADPRSVKADLTVALTMKKPAHLAYPAKEYMGAVALSDIGLSAHLDSFDSNIFALDSKAAEAMLPKRKETSNKGSFGKCVHITGSDKYRGAAHLALEASLRSGVGIVYHIGEGELNRELRLKFPEAIYLSDAELYSADSPDPVKDLVKKHNSILIGSGSSVSARLAELICKLISTEGAPLIIDADGINSLAEYSGKEALLKSHRQIILTSHPLEFSRISGLSVEYINSHRIACAEEFAAKYGVILLLKGAGTVITNGKETYINTTGSTALAKGGSGDVLAGLVASLVAFSDNPISAVALAAYLHGKAADTLSAELSEFGVTPSDLPMEIARHIKLIEEKMRGSTD